MIAHRDNPLFDGIPTEFSDPEAECQEAVDKSQSVLQAMAATSVEAFPD